MAEADFLDDGMCKDLHSLTRTSDPTDPRRTGTFRVDAARIYCTHVWIECAAFFHHVVVVV